MRVTAALLEANGQPFTLTELDLEDPRPDEVLIEVAATGICSTDLEFANFFPTPALFGHEGSGVVRAVGAQVVGVADGDHVAMSFNSCGTCSICRSGTPSYCRSFDAVNFTGRRPDGTTAVTHNGIEVNAHFLGQSSFASHAVVPARAITVIDKSIDLTVAAPFGCGIQTGAGGVLNVLRPRPGQSIAIFGAGAVGVAAIIAAAISTCGIVAAVDVNPAKLEAAVGYGATHTLDSASGDVAEQLRELAPHGFDYIIDTTGREDVLRTAVEALGPLGHAGVIGIGPSENMSFEWRSVLNGRSITGIISGGALPQVFLPQLLQWQAEGRFPVEKMMTFFPFEKINDAVAAMRSGEVGKAVLTF